MNILLAANNNYLKYVENLIFSVKTNMRKNDLKIYFINQNTSQKKINELKKRVERKYKIEFEIINISKDIFYNLPILAHFSVEMYFRLIAQYILPKELDRILWLDVDIVCLKNIEEFYCQSFDNRSMIVCADSLCEEMALKEHKNNLGMKYESKYFNSGVLLLNLKKMRRKYKMDDIINMSVQYKDKLKFPDQDILNVLYEGDVKYVNKYYNYQLIYKNNISQEDIDRIVLLHYTGPEKPWRFKCINKTSKYYWSYEKERGNYLKWISIYIVNFCYRITKKVYYMIRG